MSRSKTARSNPQPGNSCQLPAVCRNLLRPLPNRGYDIAHLQNRQGRAHTRCCVSWPFGKPASTPHPRLWTLFAGAVLPLGRMNCSFSLFPKDKWVYGPHKQSTLGARRRPWLKGSSPTLGGCSHHTWVRTWLRNPFGNMASCPSRESLRKKNQGFTVTVWDSKTSWRLQRGQWRQLSQNQCLHIQNRVNNWHLPPRAVIKNVKNAGKGF